MKITRHKCKNKKTALVLGGGAALGYAHIGVIKALEEKNFKPDLIAGTSMGAIIAAYYSVFGTMDGLVKTLEETKAAEVLIDPGFFSLGLIRCRKLEALLKKIFGDKKIKDAKIPLIINSCNVNSGENFVWKNGKIRDAVRASIAVPGIFPPLKHANAFHIDGGIGNNLVINLIPKGYDIIAVKVTPRNDKKVINNTEFSSKNPFSRSKLYFNLLNKSFTIILNKLESHLVDTNKTCLLIEPDLQKFNYASFSKYKEIINAGYKQAKKIKLG